MSGAALPRPEPDPTPAPPAGRLFHGWKIVGVMFAAQMISVGGVTYGYSLFVKPISADLGIDRSQLSWGMTGLMGVMMVIGPVAGRVLDRFSIRWLVAIGGLLMTAGFALMSIAPSALTLALCFWFPAGIGYLLAGPATASKLVAGWFERRRGLALGISAVGTSAGGFAAPPLIAGAIDAWGWRGALIAMAAASAVVVVPAALAWIVNRPSDVGLEPDGDPPAPVGTAGTGVRLWAVGDILKQPTYWGLAVGFGAPFATTGGVMTFLHAYGTDAGLSSSAAAWVISLLSAGGVAGKLAFGALGDRISPLLLSGVGIGLQALFIALLVAGPGGAGLYASAVIGGLSLGGMLPMQGTLIARCFGSTSFASVMGLMGPVMTPLIMVAMALPAVMFSEEAGYAGVLKVYLGACALAAIALLLVRPTGPR